MNAITAKARFGRSRRIGPPVRSRGFTPLLMLGLCLSQVPLRAQKENKGATSSFTLKYLETGPLSTRIKLGPQEVKFRKEPNFGKNDKIVRQALTVGPNRNDFVGFAANLSSGTLYLDLNQNLDLTDDPRGVYNTSQVLGIAGFSAYFRGVRLDLIKGGASRSYRLEPFYFIGDGTANIGIRSCYGGEIELRGRKWQFHVQDNLDGQLDGSDQCLIIPTGTDGFRGLPNRPIPVPKNLFVEGHQYQTEFAFQPSAGSSPLTVSFTETSSPMGELNLESQFIRRLVLQGDGRVVIVDSPGRTVAVPADNYRVQGVILQPASDKPALVSTPATQVFAVTAGAPCRLAVGAPIVSSVVATRKGNQLLLRYVLKGAAGEEYSISNPDKRNPPQFVIYKGDRQLASGSFQYG